LPKVGNQTKKTEIGHRNQKQTNKRGIQANTREGRRGGPRCERLRDQYWRLTAVAMISSKAAFMP